MHRSGSAASLLLMPVLNGLGHLAPAIGASWATVGGPIVDLPVLSAIFSLNVVVDSLDKYVDMAPEARPRRSLWTVWLGGFCFLNIYSTYICGLDTAVQVSRFVGIGILWGIPCVPTYSAKKNIKAIAPKKMFGIFKSLVVAVCASYIDNVTAANHACELYPQHCNLEQIYVRNLAFTILYNWTRETVCDVRDISEDTNDGLITLPTVLGRRTTLLLLTAVTLFGDAFIGGSFGIEVVFRVMTMLILSFAVVTQPRENRAAWGCLALFGLVPAWWAQIRLQ